MRRLIDLLGYDERDKLLIIHADDIGMCHSVNEATFSSLSYEIVTCGSLMMPCPWVLEAIDLAKEHDFDVGIHITLNSEWKYYKWPPVSPINEVSTLVDKYGYLWRTVRETVSYAKPSEVEREIEAQIIKAVKAGIKPSHIDTHMGTVYAKGEFLFSYIKIANKYRVPSMQVRPSDKVVKIAESQGLPVKEIKDILSKSKGPKLDMIITGIPGTSLEEKKKMFRWLLRNLEEGTVTQIIVHLGMDTPELRAIMPHSYLSRVSEYKLVTDHETRKLIEQEAIHLINWREIKYAILKQS